MKIILDKKTDTACAVIHGKSYPFYSADLVNILDNYINIEDNFAASGHISKYPEVTLEELKQYVAEQQ